MNSIDFNKCWRKNNGEQAKMFTCVNGDTVSLTPVRSDLSRLSHQKSDGSRSRTNELESSIRTFHFLTIRSVFHRHFLGRRVLAGRDSVVSIGDGP